MRLIAIGDIHGHNDKLKSILVQIDPQQSDQYVFLGDYIDRGPDSKGVIDTLIEFRAEFGRSVFLRGNHEQLMLDALEEHCPQHFSVGLQPAWNPSESGIYGNCGNFEIWSQNGGWKCLESYGVKREELANLPDCWDFVPSEHIAFIAQTELYHRQDGYLFVHAGAVETLPLDEQMETILWERHAPPGVNEIHVVGHEPCPDSEEPYFEEMRYNLDTGAGYDRKLTACDVLTKRYWQA